MRRIGTPSTSSAASSRIVTGTCIERCAGPRYLLAGDPILLSKTFVHHVGRR
jgi:hypothetical protein